MDPQHWHFAWNTRWCSGVEHTSASAGKAIRLAGRRVFVNAEADHRVFQALCHGLPIFFKDAMEASEESAIMSGNVGAGTFLKPHCPTCNGGLQDRANYAPAYARQSGQVLNSVGQG